MSTACSWKLPYPPVPRSRSDRDLGGLPPLQHDDVRRIHRELGIVRLENVGDQTRLGLDICPAGALAARSLREHDRASPAKALRARFPRRRRVAQGPEAGRLRDEEA